MTGSLVIPIIEKFRSETGRGKNQFHFGHVECDMFLGHTGGDVQQVVEIELKTEMGAAYGDFGIICIEILIEPIEANDIAYREKNRRPKTEAWDIQAYAGGKGRHT